jgi:hypothetical protein
MQTQLDELKACIQTPTVQSQPTAFTFVSDMAKVNLWSLDEVFTSVQNSARPPWRPAEAASGSSSTSTSDAFLRASFGNALRIATSELERAEEEGQLIREYMHSTVLWCHARLLALQSTAAAAGAVRDATTYHEGLRCVLAVEIRRVRKIQAEALRLFPTFQAASDGGAAEVGVETVVSVEVPEPYASDEEHNEWEDEEEDVL